MKSAYERAMEKLEAEAGPSKKLSDDEKALLAEIDMQLDAKIAELKLAYDAKLTAVAYDEAQTLQKELADEIASLNRQHEEEKNTIWNSDGH